MKFPFYKQLDSMDPIAIGCGPTCLRIACPAFTLAGVAKYYGRSISLDHLRNKSQYGKQGVSMLGLADAAESIRLKSIGAKNSFEQIITDAPFKAIVQWESTFLMRFLPAYLIKNLTMARMLTIVKMVLLKTNTNIHLIISALLSAISALISDFKAKFLYNSSLNIAMSRVIISCLFSIVLFISSLTNDTNCAASSSPNLAFTKLYNFISDMFSVSAIYQIYAFKNEK